MEVGWERYLVQIVGVCREMGVLQRTSVTPTPHREAELLKQIYYDKKGKKCPGKGQIQENGDIPDMENVGSK